MSWEATNWAIQQKTGDVGRKTVLLLLANLADEEHSCYPGQQRLADESEQSVATIKRQLKRLEEDGFIIREHRNGRGPGQGKGRTSDRYHLQVSKGQIDTLKNRVPRGQTEVPKYQMDSSQGSPVTYEPLEEPLEEEPIRAAVADALFEAPPVERIPSARDLVAAWVDGYRETHQGQDAHPHVIKRVAGQCGSLAKSCKTMDEWRDAWHAAKDAGKRNVQDPTKMLGGGTSQPTREGGSSTFLALAEKFRAEDFPVPAALIGGSLA